MVEFTILETPETNVDGQSKSQKKRARRKASRSKEVPTIHNESPTDTTKSANFQNDFCLVMVVRDEEPVITRCFDSIVNLFDSYVICDTGSLDNTIEVMQKYMDSHSKRGHIIQKEWKNFGYNKSYLLYQAYKNNLSQNAKYLMWLDADEVLLNSKTNEYLTLEDKSNLLATMDANPNVGIFQIITHNGTDRYPRWNFARNNQLYEWFLGAQECLEARNPATGTMYLYNIYDLARKEGNSSRDPSRVYKEIGWLLDDLASTDLRAKFDWLSEEERTPDPEKKAGYDCRITFYLGQTYECVGDYPNAIEYYKKRLDMGGYNQERYISMLKLCRIYKTLATVDPKNPIEELLNEAKKIIARANIEFPWRLEAFYEHMLLYDMTGSQDYKKAFAIAKISPIYSDPNPTDLFIESDVYEWKMLHNAAAIAYWAGVEESIVGLEWTNHLLLKKNPPDFILDQLRKNKNFLQEKIRESQIQKTLREIGALDFEKSSDATHSSNTLRNVASPRSLEIVTSPDNPIQLPHIVPINHVIIVDDFLPNPLAVRKLALGSEYPVTGNYPGARTTPYGHNDIKKMFEQILQRKITHWPTDSYNGSFQYTTRDMKSWIHRDCTDYAAVLYLTPNAPLNAGTRFYRHKITGAEYAPVDSDIEKILNNDSQDFSKWDVVDVVANKFNRLVMFDGRRSHMSDQYFGTCLENGRLFQTFFFDVEK